MVYINIIQSDGGKEVNGDLCQYAVDNPTSHIKANVPLYKCSIAALVRDNYS